MGLLGNDRIDKIQVTEELRLGSNAAMILESAGGTETTIDLTELAALDAISATDLAKIDGITNGTIAAGKAVVVDANKDAGDFRNLDCVNLDAGASGTAGSVDVFPTTASKGKLVISATDNTNDDAVTITNAAHGQATSVTIPDGGAATTYLVQSTAALTLAEADFLDGATAGTQVASKAVIADANVNTGISKVTELHIGASGSETQVTATGAEINAVADVSGRLIDLDATSLAITAATHGERIVTLSHTAATSTVTLPAATGTGNIFKFIVAAVNTNNHVIQVANATDVFEGAALMLQDGGDAVVGFETAATSDTLTLNGTTTGGAAIGDSVVITDYAAGKFHIEARLTGTGTEATPFSAAV